MVQIYKRQLFKCSSLSLPGSMVGNLPYTIQLELSFKAKKNKQTNSICAICCADFWISFQRNKLKICLAMAVHFGAPSEVFSRLTGVEEDQKKEPNQVTYTCSIIKIHWIYSTGKNGWWQLGHIASVQIGSGVMQSCMRRQRAFMHHVADKDFWGWERVDVGAKPGYLKPPSDHFLDDRVVIC